LVVSYVYFRGKLMKKSLLKFASNYRYADKLYYFLNRLYISEPTF
jgi:hypothetical protein